MLNFVSKLYNKLYQRACVRSAPLTAARIHAVSENLVAAIEAGRQSALSDGPLFVAMGEIHNQAVHGLAFLKTALQLKDRGYTVSVGTELPYDVPDQIITARASEMMPERLAPILVPKLEMLKNRESDDILKLQFIRNDVVENWLPHTWWHVQEKLHDRGIRYAFNDAALTESFSLSGGTQPLSLNMQDKHMQRIVAQEWPLATGVITDRCVDACDELGMYLRNKTMVQRAHEHAQRRQADIYLQHCGNVHVAGATARREAFSYSHSLVGLFEASGCNVLGFSFRRKNDERIWQIPQDANMSLVHTVTLEGETFMAQQRKKEKIWLAEVTKHLRM